MSAEPALRYSEAAELKGAVVIGAEIAAGHDGTAELLVRLRHENGVEGAVQLDTETGFDLMKAAGAASPAAMLAVGWCSVSRVLVGTSCSESGRSRRPCTGFTPLTM